MSTITLEQIRGARGMLGWSMMDLAKAAAVSVSTVKRVGDGGTAAVSASAIRQIRTALETAGVEFLDDEGRGPGIRLTPRPDHAISSFMR